MSAKVNSSDQLLTFADHLIVDASTLLIYSSVTFGTVCQAVNIFGIVTNSINIVCFFKEGFNDSINVSLLGLAVSDLGCLVTMVGTCILVMCAVSSGDLPFESLELSYVLTMTPHFAFTRVSSCITAMITLERYLSIAVPLKIKDIVTPQRVKWVIITIFVCSLASMTPIFVVNKLGMKISTISNTTIFGVIFGTYRDRVETIYLSINNFFIPLSAFLMICMCTVILSIQLHNKNKLRKTLSTTEQSDRISTRNQKVAKMVLIISSLFIICFLPTTTIMLAVAFEHELHLAGKYVSVALMLGEFSYIMESVNSSVNTFIYYRMSTKYRNTFVKLFGCKSR